MKKRILSVLLMAVMIVSLTPLSVYAANTAVPTDSWNDDGNVATAFAGGRGTKEDPYKIKTAEQLAKISNDVAAGNSYIGSYFRLENNIDLSAHRWIPIGNFSTTSFRGFLDGNDKTITGMMVDSREDKVFAGLFGYIINVIPDNEVGVKDLTIGNAALYLGEEETKEVCAGVLAARVMVNSDVAGTGVFENIDVSGTIEVKAPNGKQRIGGLIGDDNRCIVKNCVADVTITGASNSGGMTGSSGGSTFENCIAKGKVSGYKSLGGFVGSVSSVDDYNTGGSTFIKCIADVDVEASGYYVGGFAGVADCEKFDRCASLGNVTSTYDNGESNPCIGGFVGNVGYSEYNYSADLIKCHSASLVTSASKNSKTGGFAGNLEAGTFNGCSYDNEKNSNLKAVVGEETTNQQVVACTTQKTLSNICVDVYGGHKYAEEFTVDIQPTCIKEGFQSKHCTRCNISDESVILKPDPFNHESLKHVDAKAATKDQEGNIEYWYCDACGKYFADKSGKEQIEQADTVIAKLPADPAKPAAGKDNDQKKDSSASTGDDASLGLWAALLMLSGCAAAGAVIYRRKQNSAK